MTSLKLRGSFHLIRRRKTSQNRILVGSSANLSLKAITCFGRLVFLVYHDVVNKNIFFVEN